MDILMPQLGETVAEGTVTNWYKRVGDSVKADEALFDVETDKVATEIPSPIAGVLTEVLVPAGKTVKVGTRLAVVLASGEAAKSNAAAPEAGRGDPASPAAPAQPAFDRLYREAGTQNGNLAPESRVRGNDLNSRAGASYRTPRTDASYGSARTGASVHSSGSARSDSPQKLSPVVRRLLAEHEIAAHEVRGSGRDGRITRDDVLAHIENRTDADRATPAATESAVPFVVARGPGSTEETKDVLAQAGGMPTRAEAQGRQAPGASERVVALNNIRRRSAAAMARAWQVVPHVLQAVEADYSRIEQARRTKGAAWQAREGFELTYLPFLAWAVCQALARYEQLNARIEADSLVVSSRVHLGIAVDLNHEGLVVPVIRDAQDRNVPALAREIRRLALAARGNKLTPDDLAQPTYTISNSGVFGTLITAPIVNPPQVAILSTDGITKRPVVVETPAGDSIAIRPVGVLAQSFDHRAVDGAYSAGFLKELRRIVETRAWIDDLA